MNEEFPESERILILTLNDREARVAKDQLEDAGLVAHVCADMRGLCEEIESGAGAALVVEEHLLDGGSKLESILSRQPPWSDFPLLVVSARKRSPQQTEEPLANLGNVTLLDPPLRIRTIIRAAHMALRGRKRQYAARRAIVERDRFLAMLGHELRNPLSAIALATELASRTAGTDASHVPVLQRQVAHLTRLVDDLLDVARVTSGRITLDLEPARLDRLLAEVTAPMLRRFEEAKILLDLEVEASPIVSGDPVRLEQVISNLLTNALKYTLRGGLVRARVWEDGEHAHLAVTDDGAGIPKDVLPHIFEPFVQGESTLDRAQGGMGVGLALVRTLVELHGGSVSAASEGRGKGSTFRVRLPLLEDTASSRGPHDGRVERLASDGGRTVLVVEDNDDARELLACALHQAGHSVVQAADGEEALNVLGAHAVDAAIVDIGLPRLDGFEVARRARNRCGTNLLLIALSGYGQPKDRREALEAGFDVHLTKPTDLVSLCALLEHSQPAPP